MTNTPPTLNPAACRNTEPLLPESSVGLLMKRELPGAAVIDGGAATAR